MPISSMIVKTSDGTWQDEKADLKDYACKVVTCKREGSIFVIYALLGWFSCYDPLVLGKGTTRSFVWVESQAMTTKYTMGAVG